MCQLCSDRFTDARKVHQLDTETCRYMSLFGSTRLMCDNIRIDITATDYECMK